MKITFTNHAKTDGLEVPVFYSKGDQIKDVKPKWLLTRSRFDLKSDF